MKNKFLLAASLMLSAASALAQPASFSEPQLLIKATDCGLMAPVWSPDGQYLAVAGDNFNGIWVAKADGSDLRQVTQNTGAGYQMKWSDEQTLITTPYTYVDNQRMTRIEEVNVVSGTSQLVGQPQHDFKRSRVMRNAGTVLETMVDNPLKATEQIPALNAYAGKMVINPALSPDGSKIAFQIVSNGLFVINADGTGLTALGKGSHATWLPDGKNLLLTRISDDGNVFTQSDIYCLNLDTRKELNITPSTDVIPVTMALSPDGSKLAFDNDSDGCIYVINLKY
ncbi:MAG: PD40 domain-containing protein [Muribaculaceae bacterium]|nr:PD40 domain-containing protein [Muribaculaceae bacterium]